MPFDLPPIRKPGQPLSLRRGIADRPQLHVVMRHLRWHVVTPHEAGSYSAHDRRDDAVAAAKIMALRTGANVVVFDLGGRPLPPETPLSRAG